MARHVSTKQIIEHIKTVNKISVDGIIYDNFKLTDTALIVNDYTFPFDYFDIGGMDKNSLILVDESHAWRRVQFHTQDNVTINHPKWDHEEYDTNRIRNHEIMAIAHQQKFDK